MRFESLESQQASPMTAQTDVHGRAAFHDLGPGSYLVTSDRGHERRVQLVRGETQIIELLVPGGVAIRGRVIAGNGSLIPFAEIWAYRLGNETGGRRVATADASAEYVVPDIDPALWLGARAENCVDGSLVHLDGMVGDLQAGTPLDLDLFLVGQSRAIHGFVSDSSGEPIQGARVVVGALSGTGRLVFAARGCILTSGPARAGVSDTNGQFRVGSISRATPFVLTAEAPGFVPKTIHINRLGVDGRERVDFSLERGGAVRVRVVDAEGRAQSGVRVEAHCLGSGEQQVSLTGENGESRLAGLRMGLYEFWCLSDGGPTPAGVKSTLEVTGAAEKVWDVVLADRSGIVGRILGGEGVSFAGCRVELVHEKSKSWNKAGLLHVPGDVQRMSVGGRFAFAARHGETYELRLWEPSQSASPLYRWSGLTASGSGIELNPADAFDSACRVKGRMANRPAPHETIQLWSRELSEPITIEPAVDDEPFALEGLWPGTYRLFCIAPGQAPTLLREFALDAGEDRDLGEVSVLNPGRLVVRFRGSAALLKRAKRASVTIAGSYGGDLSLMAGRGTHQDKWISATEFQVPSVSPGEYLLAIAGPGFAWIQREISIESGEVTYFDCDLVPAQALTLDLELPLQVAESAAASVLMFERADGLVLTRRLPAFQRTTGSDEFSQSLRLPDGSWRMRAEVQGEFVEVEFHLPRGGDYLKVHSGDWRPSAGPFLFGSQNLRHLFEHSARRMDVTSGGLGR